jgi:hypothetical protein
VWVSGAGYQAHSQVTFSRLVLMRIGTSNANHAVTFPATSITVLTALQESICTEASLPEADAGRAEKSLDDTARKPLEKCGQTASQSIFGAACTLDKLLEGGFCRQIDDPPHPASTTSSQNQPFDEYQRRRRPLPRGPPMRSRQAICIETSVNLSHHAHPSPPVFLCPAEQTRRLRDVYMVSDELV